MFTEEVDVVKAKSSTVIVLLIAALLLLSGCMVLNSPPTASFTLTPSSGDSPLTVSFNASASHDSDGTIATYQWMFGDGSSDTGVTTSHTYTTTASNRNYSAVLKVTDNEGAQATRSRTISVTGPSPLQANFEITDWTQNYYESLQEYGLVRVYYKVTNTGSVDIDYYKVWIEVRCTDGSTYQEWTNGVGVDCGTYATDYTLINTADKRAVSVSITKKELTSY